jgi:hypothetical protein
VDGMSKNKERIADKLLESLKQAVEMDNDNKDVIIYFNNKPHSYLNRGMLTRQKAWDNLDAIKAEHVIKLNIYAAIEKETDKAALKAYAQNLTDLEFKLQELWGFSEDAKFHRFWWTPKCQCAKIDNEDAYPTGYYTVNSECPLHGDV